MKIKTRFIKQTTITLSETDVENLRNEMIEIRRQFSAGDIPATSAIIDNLIEVQTPRNYLD